MAAQKRKPDTIIDEDREHVKAKKSDDDGVTLAYPTKTAGKVIFTARARIAENGFRDPTESDLTIICGKRRFYVHRAVMLDTLRGKYRLSERSDAEIVSTMSSVDHEGDDPAVLHAFLLGLYEDPQNVEQHVAEVCKRPTNEEQCIKYGHGVAAEYKAVVGDFEDFKMHEMFTPTYITCMERTCDCAPPEQRALWDYRQLSAPGKNIAGHFCKELKAHIDLWILAGKYDAEASAFAHDFALDLLQDCWASPDILDVAEKVFNYTGGDMSTPLAGKIAKGLFCRLSQYAPSVEFTSFLERQPQFQRYIDDSCAGGPRPRLRGDTRYCSRVACRRNVTPSLEYACLCRHYGEELLLPAKTPRDVFGTGGRTTGDKTKT